MREENRRSGKEEREAFLSASDRLKKRMQRLAQEDLCLAFSGGVDSALLLELAAGSAAESGKRVAAVTFHTQLHAPCDLEAARRVAQEIQARYPRARLSHTVLSVDELEQEEIRCNPVNRCYLCKRLLFGRLREFAGREGIDAVAEGSHADDRKEYRPGLLAVEELGILSPLAESGMGKQMIKELAAQYSISVADRPSMPCMATRLPYGANLQYELLHRIAEAEAWLRGIFPGNVRLRVHHETARLELDAAQMPLAVQKRKEIAEKLRQYGFAYITLDLEGFRSGSMDEPLMVGRQKGKEKR